MAIHRGGAVKRRKVLRVAKLGKRKAKLGKLAKSVRSTTSALKTQQDVQEVEVSKDASGMSETMLKNIALEAVRTGNYWASPEQQGEVVSYIAEVHAELLQDTKFLKKNGSKLERPNGLTERYSVAEILTKQHETDGFDVFAKADVACAIAEAKAVDKSTSSVVAGTFLIAKKDVRVFRSTVSWDRVSMLSAGLRIEAAGAPTTVEGFSMVPLKPDGAVEMQYMTVVDSSLGAETTSTSPSSSDTGMVMAALRESLEGIESLEDPADAHEILHLTERCSSVGELGAAVYCGTRLELIMEKVESPKLRGELLDRAFDGLKALLRPGVRNKTCELEGPWSKAPSGRAGKPNHHKSLGQLLQRLQNTRKEQKLVEGGEAAKKEHQHAVAQETTFENACAALASFLSEDAKIGEIKRRGALCEAVERVSAERGLKISSNLAFAIVRQLEKMEIVSARGREVIFHKDAVSTQQLAPPSLSAFGEKIDELEQLAKQRLQSRQKRQKARQLGKNAKRQRMEDDD